MLTKYPQVARCKFGEVEPHCHFLIQCTLAGKRWIHGCYGPSQTLWSESVFQRQSPSDFFVSPTVELLNSSREHGNLFLAIILKPVPNIEARRKKSSSQTTISKNSLIYWQGIFHRHFSSTSRGNKIVILIILKPCLLFFAFTKL